MLCIGLEVERDPHLYLARQPERQEPCGKHASHHCRSSRASRRKPPIWLGKARRKLPFRVQHSWDKVGFRLAPGNGNKEVKVLHELDQKSHDFRRELRLPRPRMGCGVLREPPQVGSQELVIQLAVLLEVLQLRPEARQPDHVVQQPQLIIHVRLL
eukprot:2900353-Rhodomonas_salina.3